MKVKLENLVVAIKELVEAGREEELVRISKENGYFVTANKVVVRDAKTIMLKAEHDAAAAEGRKAKPRRLAALSGETRICQPD